MVDVIEVTEAMSADQLVIWLDQQGRRNRQVRELDRAIHRTNKLLTQAEHVLMGCSDEERSIYLQRIEALKRRLFRQLEHRKFTVQAEDRFLTQLST